MSDGPEIGETRPGEKDLSEEVGDFMERLGARLVFAIIIMPDTGDAFCATVASDSEVAQQWLDRGAAALRAQADRVERLDRVKRVTLGTMKS